MVTDGILGGFRKYVRVAVPVLAIFAHPEPRGAFASDSARAAFIASESAYRARQAAVVRRASPFARIVDVPGASHYVFLTDEAQVIREINAFVRSLP